MKERPILFSGPMVKAILDGSKTMTRRVVKGTFPTDAEILKRVGTGYGWYQCDDWGKPDQFRITGPVGVIRGLGHPTQIKCPYGVPGDRLYVRENLQLQELLGEEPPLWGWCYQADSIEVGACPPGGKELEFMADPGTVIPSIFMPRWASRITLEVVSVKVERLQDISIQDALYEGVRCPDCGYTSLDAGYHMDHGICINKWLKESHVKDVGDHSAIAAFHELWDSINGKTHPWSANPWVWVVSFKVTRPLQESHDDGGEV